MTLYEETRELWINRKEVIRKVRESISDFFIDTIGAIGGFLGGIILAFLKWLPLAILLAIFL